MTAPSTVALLKPAGCPRCPRKPATNYREAYRILTIGLYGEVIVPKYGEVIVQSTGK